jgi:hypothetical protein
LREDATPGCDVAEPSLGELFEGLLVYLELGTRPGDFLRQALENNFSAAILAADPQVFPRLRDLAAYLDSSAFPPEAWGSPRKVEAWIQRRGLLGPDAKPASFVLCAETLLAELPACDPAEVDLDDGDPDER